MVLDAIVGQQVPPVTRNLVLACITLTSLCHLDVISHLDLYLGWELVIRELQLWRLVTCFLFCGDFGMSFCWNMYVVIQLFSCAEEAIFFGKPADFVWMMTCVAGMSLCLSYFIAYGEISFYGSTQIDVLIYMWARQNPTGRVQLLFLQFQAVYLPWVLSLVQVLAGSSLRTELMGIGLGHVCYFFHAVYPLMPTSRGFRLFRAPHLLKVMCGQRE